MARILILCAICGAIFGIEFVNFDEKLLNEKFYLVSEKFDGVRGIWDGKHLKTKNGNIINAPTFFLQDLPDFGLDGELWLGYGKFEIIQGLVAKKNADKNAWKSVRYKIFDSDICKNCKLLERLQLAKARTKSEFVEFIEQEKIQNDANFQKILDEKLKMILQKGGEGLIIRAFDEEFSTKRSTKSFKLKAQNDAECVVVGYIDGKGKFSSKMGSLICEGEFSKNSDLNALQWENLAKSCAHKNIQCSDDKIKIRFKIGSGFSEQMRANPPKIGEKIVYKYSAFSKFGIPKHAVFLRKF